MNSRFTCRLRAALRLSALVIFLALGLLYAGLSMTADWAYALGLRTNDIAAFDLAARLFPLNRNRRLGGAYAHALFPGPPEAARDAILRALSTDVNAPDLWTHLALVDLKLRDETGYTLALKQLDRLTRQQVVRVATEPATKGQP